MSNREALYDEIKAVSTELSVSEHPRVRPIADLWVTSKGRGWLARGEYGMHPAF